MSTDCEHVTWCACTKYRSPHGLPPLGTQPRRKTFSIHWTHQPRSETGVGSESPLRRLDRSPLVLHPGLRVIVRDRIHLGPGYLVGSITPDPEGPWYIIFDNGQEDIARPHLIEKAFEL